MYPKDGGQWCAKHMKKGGKKDTNTVSRIEPPPEPAPPKVLKKRGFSMLSVDESNIEPVPKKNILEFAQGDHYDELRNYYANKNPAAKDKLLPIIEDDDSPAGGLNISDPIIYSDEEEPQRRKVLVVDKHGRETELEDDELGADLDEANLDTDEEAIDPMEHDDLNPFHPIVMAEVGAVHCLQVIEEVGGVPGYKDAIISIPQWRMALRKVLKDRLKHLDALPAEWVLGGITMGVFLSMKFQKIHPSTQPADAEPDPDSSSGPRGGEELPPNTP